MGHPAINEPGGVGWDLVLFCCLSRFGPVSCGLPFGFPRQPSYKLTWNLTFWGAAFPCVRFHVNWWEGKEAAEKAAPDVCSAALGLGRSTGADAGRGGEAIRRIRSRGSPVVDFRSHRNRIETTGKRCLLVFAESNHARVS